MSEFVILEFTDDERCKQFIEATKRDTFVYYHNKEFTFESTTVRVAGTTLGDKSKRRG